MAYDIPLKWHIALEESCWGKERETTVGSDTITPAGYLPRIVDGEIRSALRTMPAVVVEGPRACGKTWTGRRFSRSAVFLDERVNEALSAGMDPGGVLDGKAPRLLDEWQLAPGIWNPMRHACDRRAKPGQFILTGSANPPDDLTRHSGRVASSKCECAL